MELDPIDVTDEDVADDPRHAGPDAGRRRAVRARRRAPRHPQEEVLERLSRCSERGGAAPRGRDPLPPPRRLLGQRHGRLGGARRTRSSRRASGWPPSAASPTATSARPTPTGPTPSSPWPTAAPRRSATRSSTRSPTQTGIDERATLYSSTEFKKVRMLYFTDDFRALGSGSTRPDHLPDRHRSAELYRRARARAARRRELARAGDARDRARPALRRARRRAPRSPTSTATPTSTTSARGAR